MTKRICPFSETTWYGIDIEPAISVFVEEENEIVIKPEKKRLLKKEKLALSKKLAGSADRFSLEGVKETICIANREYDR
ncbi:hypothetical protein FZC79_19760 [Rossellomorea vietnamensis]|uniref:Uncharacterized protein n=1 Tax=Rossellomorea vietnamensis TaxID=218284 RepID=A0A5D4KAN6_9BACI|nr:hypothetical protein [Rossellomorea vietnamensis]TYR73143.1 hypothetical protein FZC79_19760 [Rossellomorea vietnamensis]